MDEKLKKKMSDREYRRAFAEGFLDDSLALQIRTLREKRQLSQDDLAERTGMKQATISRIENSEYGRWTISTLKRLARALDLPLSVRFQSWGELLDDASHFTPECLSIPGFERDPAFVVPESAGSTQERSPRWTISTGYRTVGASLLSTTEKVPVTGLNG